MKIIQTVAAIAFSATLLIASVATAQLLTLPALSQQMEVTTEFTAKATNSNSPMSMGTVHEMTRTAVSNGTTELAALIPGATRAFSAQLGIQMAQLANGATKSFTTGIMKSANVLDRRSLAVKVTYDPRPIGGILSVRVDLVPVFNGIGGASRATATRATAISVDNLDEKTVTEIVSRLSLELAGEGM